MPMITLHRIGRIRSAFTLAEILVALVLLGVIGTALTSVMARQQRFYRGTSDVVDVRTQLRQAQSLLYSDLRGVSSSGGDIVAMTDSSIDFRYPIGASIVCVKAATTFIVPPTTLASGTILSSWITQPAAGDDVYVYDDGANTASSADDVWQKYGISSVVATVGGCPATTKFTALGDAASSSWTVTVGSTLSATVLAGAPVRFVRRAHYSLFNNAKDKNWYLGYCQGSCTGTNAIQPIAGPFLPYSSSGGSGTSGIRITYYDTLGNVTTTAASVGQVSLVLRGQTAAVVSQTGGSKQQKYLDSARVVITLRNPK